jgi:hypothetical protein
VTQAEVISAIRELGGRATAVQVHRILMARDPRRPSGTNGLNRVYPYLNRLVRNGELVREILDETPGSGRSRTAYRIAERR